MLDRRSFLGTGLVFVAGPALCDALGPSLRGTLAEPVVDDTPSMQAAIDHAASTGVPLRLGPGVFQVSGLVLPSGLVLQGVGGATRLIGSGRVLALIDGTDQVRISDLVLDGSGMGESPAAPGVLTVTGARRLWLERVEIRSAPGDGLFLDATQGVLRDLTITGPRRHGVVIMNGRGVEMSAGQVLSPGGSGVQIVRRERGPDATRIEGLRLEAARGSAAVSIKRASGVSLSRIVIEGALGAGVEIIDAHATGIEATHILRAQGAGVRVLGASMRTRVTMSRIEDAATGIEDRGPGPGLYTANAMTRCRIGIALAAPDGGHVITNNLITGTETGAVVSIDSDGKPRAETSRREPSPG